MKCAGKGEQASGMLLIEGFLVGGCAGLVAIVYRRLLSWAEEAVMWISTQLRADLLWLPLVLVMLVLIGVGIAALLRWEPMISGSGIPQIEGEVQGTIDQNWKRVIPCKMAAGTLAALGGLSLGREGPSIQLGGMCGKGVATLLHRESHARSLITCGSGAGLAAAFNAPLSGILFCLEEVLKDFRTPLLLAVVIAALTGDFLSRAAFGFAPSFDFALESSLPLSAYGWVLLLGVVAGAAGAFYNYATLRMPALYARLSFVKPHQRVCIALLVSALCMVFLPQVLCGGHAMIALLERSPRLLGTLLFLLGMKFLFSLVSFGSGAAGGIFFPLLVLGSYLGAAYGCLVTSLGGMNEAYINNFIILGMAALFSGIVRAPLTGIVLIMEMCGGLPQLLSLTLVSLTAYLSAQALGSRPIYESLLERMTKKAPSRS